MQLKILLYVIRYFSRKYAGRKSKQYFFSLLHKWSLEGMNYSKGGEIESSGEIWLLNHLRNILRPDSVIFDVGANEGKYAKEARKAFPTAVIYAFEPQSDNYKQLLKNTKEDNLLIKNFAFGERCKKAMLYGNKEYPGIYSAYKRNLQRLGIEVADSEEIEITTINDFCNKNNIYQVDLLKIDAEGSELDILKGAVEKINSIKYIQFEFGGCNIDSGTYFKDFYNLLTPNFRLYWVLQDGLEPIQQYNEALEIFTTANYLAISKQNPAQ